MKKQSLCQQKNRLNGQRLVYVYVEGYEDVSFWRSIFDHFANPYLRFEISVPMRKDLPKGKKVLLDMVSQSSKEMLLCVDSDFDYLFHEATPTSKIVSKAEFMFHTYTYATENYLCYAPSLHNVCVKATKNDMRIFDFERFMAEYSRTIYPAFLWYAFAAKMGNKVMFKLSDFRTTVRISRVDVATNGAKTVAWVASNVRRCLSRLQQEHSDKLEQFDEFKRSIEPRGVTAENCYLYMQGHTLMDNVVMIVLQNVCDRLRQMSLDRITSSSKRGTALHNEISNYKNTQRSIRDVLLDNENYTDCHLYKRLKNDIERYVERSISEIKAER